MPKLNLDYATEVYRVCRHRAMLAAREFAPTPMDVTDGATMWHVPDGLCGFAWISIPGNTPLGRAWKSLGLAKKAYPKGLSIWVSEFNQSYELKSVYARAFVKALRTISPDLAVGVYADSRLD